MKGFTIVEQGHLVQLIDPVSATAPTTSETFIMEAWAHASIIVMGGGGSGLTTITVNECTSFAGSDATAIGYNYAQETTVDGDTLDAALAAATAGGIAIGTSNVFLIIELDGDELSDGYPYVQIHATAPATARLLAAAVVLSGGRYQEDITATAIV